MQKNAYSFRFHLAAHSFDWKSLSIIGGNMKLDPAILAKVREGIIQVDWRIPLDLERAWRDGILEFGEPKDLVRYLVKEFKERKRRGNLPNYEFPKVGGGDSRKRIRVYYSDYWEAECYANGFELATSRFLSAVLDFEWKSGGFRSLGEKGALLKARSSNEKVKDFPVQKGSLLGKMA